MICILALFYVQTTFAQMQYHRVKVYTPENSIRDLAALGIETDHGQLRPGVWFITDLSDFEITKISNAGFRYEVMIADVQKFYTQQNIISTPVVSKSTAAGCSGINAPVYQTPVNFSLGSMGGYFTYQQMLDNLDSMASKYPTLISIKQPVGLGTTIEGRPIYYVKISDNVNIDEPEPEMLYTAVHHAREPGGMSQLIFYMWYILENYNSDPEITQIVNDVELFFIPCVNPDGYLENEVNNPGGGGMWRKNKRPNLDGSVGVDLNRNYGYNWGFDDDGSSPVGIDATYRGTGPFSEPETQLVRDFVNTREFLIALNYHTYGNLLIYPWGYDYDIYTPDSALLVNYGSLLTTYNGYTYGTANQTVGYIVNGSSDDWMYGEQIAKPKILAMTPEAGDGNFGFWPPSSQIIGICNDNMFQNINAALLTGKYATVAETSPVLFNTYADMARFTISQLGLDTTGSYTVSVSAVTSNITFIGQPKVFSGLGLMQQVNDSIEIHVSSPMTFGDPVVYVLKIDNGTTVRSDTIYRTFGTPVAIYSNNGGTLGGWNPGGWGLSTSVFFSAPSSITDSPSGNYQDNNTNTCTLNTTLDLSNAIDAKLRFMARWEIEPGYDYVLVQASDNNGLNWTTLCGKYTKPGSSSQIPGEPLYDGFQTSWVEEEMDLSAFAGSSNVIIRFIIQSDFFLNYDGYYFDDLSVQVVLPGSTGLAEFGEFNFYLAPNPAKNDLVVNFSRSTLSESRLLIYDISGRIIRQMKVLPGVRSIQVDLTGISAGIYVVELLEDSAGKKSKKLIIE